MHRERIRELIGEFEFVDDFQWFELAKVAGKLHETVMKGAMLVSPHELDYEVAAVTIRFREVLEEVGNREKEAGKVGSVIGEAVKSVGLQYCTTLKTHNKWRWFDSEEENMLQTTCTTHLRALEAGLKDCRRLLQQSDLVRVAEQATDPAQADGTERASKDSDPASKATEEGEMAGQDGDQESFVLQTDNVSDASSREDNNGSRIKITRVAEVDEVTSEDAETPIKRTKTEHEPYSPQQSPQGAASCFADGLRRWQAATENI